MPKPRRPAENPALEAAARAMAVELARKAYGDGGFCTQVQRIADTRYFRCYIGHQPGKAGRLVRKTVTVKVEG